MLRALRIVRTSKRQKGNKAPLILLLVFPLLLGFGLASTTASASRAEKKEKTMAQATFAGGCFWCMEPPFEKLDGVIKVESGYTGGKEKNPTYQEVASGSTSHAEAVLVTFEPSKVAYTSLLDVFWRQIDPTDGSGQFADRGDQYRTAIYYHDETQKKLAEQSKKALAASGRFSSPIVTPVLPAGPFYRAEEYHQDFYKKNPAHYKSYRTGSGREYFIKSVWGQSLPARRAQKSCDIWAGSAGDGSAPNKNRLSRLQYAVTQKGGTEPPFDNAYWSSKEPGIYVDVVSGEPLFSSIDKFDSGTGWPSFTRPLDSSNVVEKMDTTHGMARVEVKSRCANSHLGHVFDDGPGPSGKRYCINSAALEFIPKKELRKRGYGEYEALFR